jgi:hypothetical protein
MSVTEPHHSGADRAEARDPADVDLPEGPPAAALVAAGVGCLAMGVLTSAAEASESFADKLNLRDAVGALSGKTTYAVVVWLLSWAVLHAWMRRRPLPLRRALTGCLLLTGAGFLLTFPTVFELFA